MAPSGWARTRCSSTLPQRVEIYRLRDPDYQALIIDPWPDHTAIALRAVRPAESAKIDNRAIAKERCMPGQIAREVGEARNYPGC